MTPKPYELWRLEDFLYKVWNFYQSSISLILEPFLSSMKLVKRYAKIGIILASRNFMEKVYIFTTIMHIHGIRQKCLFKIKYSKSPINSTV